jgi:hypothetical protein
MEAGLRYFLAQIEVGLSKITLMKWKMDEGTYILNRSWMDDQTLKMIKRLRNGYLE